MISKRLLWQTYVAVLGIMCFFFSCEDRDASQSKVTDRVKPQPDTVKYQSLTVYQTKNLIVQKLSDHIYEHRSFLTTTDFGIVGCNGMIVVSNNEAVIFDTPANDTSSQELINYAKKTGWKIKAVIPTHFHEDCVGGLAIFKEARIAAYASYRTIKLLQAKGNQFSGTLIGFDDSLSMKVGNQFLYAEYFGEGHTKDNIVGYFPSDKALFGGCLVKELGAGKGNLADANVLGWPATVSSLKQRHPSISIVIPGHGKSGGIELLDYTIKLFHQ